MGYGGLIVGVDYHLLAIDHAAELYLDRAKPLWVSVEPSGIVCMEYAVLDARKVRDAVVGREDHREWFGAVATWLDEYGPARIFPDNITESIGVIRQCEKHFELARSKETGILRAVEVER